MTRGLHTHKHLANDGQKEGSNGSGGFKNSLRKLPSTLFLRGGGGDVPSTNAAGTTAARPKARKGLAGILGRSRASPPIVTDTLVTTQATQSGRTASSSTRATPGSSRSRWLHPYTAHSGTAGAPVQPENKQRPSCGPDPFVRNGRDGARIIARPYAAEINPTDAAPVAAATVKDTKQGLQERYEKEERRLSSVTAPVAVPRTTMPDERDESWVASLSNYAVPEFELRPAFQVANTASPAKVLLKDASATPAPHKTLKKDRTRSKVWSMLTLNKKKKGTNGSPAETEPASRGVSPPPVGAPAICSPPRLAARIPSLHITKPSADFGSLPGSPHFTDPTSPFLSSRAWSLGTNSTFSTDRRSLPVRKSLSGLFGLDLKQSLANIDPSARASHKTPLGSPKVDSFTPGRFDDAATPDLKFHSRFGNVAFSPAKRTFTPAGEHLAEPEDLGNSNVSPNTADFFSRYGSSPTTERSSQDQDLSLNDMSTATRQLSKILAQMGAKSPTPTKSPRGIRSFRSALLGSRGSKAEAKESNSDSNTPVKPRVLQDSVASRSPKKSPVIGTPVRSSRVSPVTSMVKRGMRNIFAPSSPASPLASAVRTKSPLKARSPIEVMSSPPTDMADCSSSWSPIPTDGEDVADHLLSRSEASSPSLQKTRNARQSGRITSSGSNPYTLGLPVPPPSNRVVDRHAHRRQTFRQPMDNTFLQVYTEAEDDDNGNRASFDFTGEYASLSFGQRESFMDALRRVQGESIDQSPFRTYAAPHAPKIPTLQIDIDDDVEDIADEEEEEQEQEEQEVLDSPILDRNKRLSSPFKGQAAFQGFVQQTNSAKKALYSYSGPSAQAGQRRRGRPSHEKNRSDISFASISSLGAPIGTRSEWMNAFERNFASFDAPPPIMPLPPLPSFPSFPSIAETDGSGFNGARSGSVLSFESLNNADISFASGFSMTSGISYGSGAPPAMRNNHRLPSNNRMGRNRNVSSGSGFGRSDWRSQRISTSSNLSASSSAVSLARLGRPGLGDRMFDRDQGVQLTSLEESRASDDSWLPMDRGRHFSHSSTAEGFYDGSTEGESFFGSSDGHSNGPGERVNPPEFFLKGIRHMSVISLSSDEDGLTAQFGSPTLKGDALVVEPLVPRNRPSAAGPSRPRETRHHHRPVPLSLNEDEETPGLTSACTSTDASSFFSVDFGYSMHRKAGSFAMSSHSRQKSSVASCVQVQPTIKEEDSLATLRNQPPMTKVAHDVRVCGSNEDYDASLDTSASLAAWENEAHEVYLITRAKWSDNSASERAVMAFSSELMDDDGIVAFIANSQAMYKPLDEAKERKAVTRHKSSLSATREAVAPYGLWVIPPPASRFRNKRSSNSSDELPVSPLLAEFARDGMTPSPLPTEGDEGVQVSDADQSFVDFRPQVTSSARRRALGWGRRRPSDADKFLASGGSPPQGKLPTSATEVQFPGVVRPRRRITRSETVPSYLCFSPVKHEEVVKTAPEMSPVESVSTSVLRPCESTTRLRSRSRSSLMPPSVEWQPSVVVDVAPQPQPQQPLASEESTSTLYSEASQAELLAKADDSVLLFTPKSSPAGTRRRRGAGAAGRPPMHVHVDATGSPVNLATYEGRVPLVRGSSDGGNYRPSARERGQSPLRRMAPLKPLQLGNRAIVPLPSRRSPATLKDMRPGGAAQVAQQPIRSDMGMDATLPHSKIPVRSLVV